MDETADTEAILGLCIFDGVTAADDGSGFPDFLVTAPQDLAGDLCVQIFRNAENVHGQLRCASHRINVAERIGRGDLSIGKRVVYHRRENIHGLNQRRRVVYPVNSGIVAGIEAHKKIGVVEFG